MNPLSGPLFIALGVLVVAGVAKTLRPSPTAAALSALSVPQPLIAARLLGVAEIILGLSAAIFGLPVLYGLVAAAYGAFTLFVLWALNGNQQVVSCGCFGHEDTPPTMGHVVFNAVAVAIAALAVTDPTTIADFDGTLAEGVLTVAAVALGVATVIAALSALPRVLALVRGTAAPTVHQFALDSRGNQ